MKLLETMNTPEQILHFLKKCAESIKKQSNDAIVLEGAETFSQRLESPLVKEFHANLLPVIKQIDHVSYTAFTFNFHQIARKMVWRPSPRTDEKGQQMALGIFNELFDFGNMVAGLLLVDKHQGYPLHQHQAQELYLVLSGEADWRYGGSNNFKKLVPGDVIYNHPNDIHGVIAGNEAVLALYVLWK